ncbi:MAG: hypothetical protein CMC70_01375 [Flavobacteriaceae bacterium]|nr:hypothetical protein [Flavobacteriaceae bacterium]
MKMQMGTASVASEWVPPLELPNLTESKTIAIDVETKDPNLKKMGPGWARGDGEIVGYAIATADWSGYIPTRHEGGGNLDEKIVSRWLRKVFECPADKIMHNAQYDLGWIKRMGFDVKGRVIDTMVCSSLLDENRYSYSLNALCYEWLGIAKSEKLLNQAAADFGYDAKAEMYKMPAMFVGPYAENDAEITLKLWNYLSVQLTQQELWGVANLELDLLPCLVDMTWRGVRVDTDRAEITRNHLLKEEKKVLAEIKREAGFAVEIWAAASIAKAFDTKGIKYDRTEKGAPSFRKKFLTEHPEKLPQLIVQARNLNKTSGTFINNILNFCAKDGRIHSHINQIRSDDGGTVSGRFSMNNPNLQQIPARDPVIGPMIRSLFLPEKDEHWASIDYSQQEPRILVHYASRYSKTRGGEPLGGVEEFVKKYTEDPRTDFHTMVAEMAGIGRKQAKTVNLGIMYGMGVAKLALELGLPNDEAKDLIQQYHTRVPFVKGLMKGVTQHLNESGSAGHVKSLMGRKCRFDLWEPDMFGMFKALPLVEAKREHPLNRLVRAGTYKALNRLIQASAADMTKKAMVDLYQSGFLPMLQIHDELAMSVKSKKEAKKISQIMVNAVPLEVPNLCDVAMGPNWGEAV